MAVAAFPFFVVIGSTASSLYVSRLNRIGYHVAAKKFLTRARGQNYCDEQYLSHCPYRMAWRISTY